VKAVKEGGDVKKCGGERIKERIKKMNVAHLKVALKSHGLPIDRLKADL
jgi:hypothetical protein